tara:strand:- start:5171 stop:5602 length:432 start_codon:yes stop_codon:yes gene_type:complete
MLESVTVTPTTPTREQIVRLEKLLLQGPTIEIPPKHYFADGLYAREITIPAGVVLTGKIHRTEHINVVSKGCITVWTEEGMKKLSAPSTFVSSPGTKRAGYAHEETVWTTFHSSPFNERDLVRLEETFIVPENNQLEGSPCLG